MMTQMTHDSTTFPFGFEDKFLVMNARLRLLTYQAVQQNLNTSGEHRDEALPSPVLREVSE